MLSEDEHKRQADLFEDMLEDLKTWRASFTEEEKGAHKALAEFLHENDAERDDFLVDYDNAFETANTSGNGILDKDEFRAYVDKIDEISVGIGLKHRESTNAYVDMCWKVFNGYNQDHDGVKKEEIDYVINYITMKGEQATEETEQVDRSIIQLAQLANLARKWQADDEGRRVEV